MEDYGKHVTEQNRRLQPKRGYFNSLSGRDMVRKQVDIQEISVTAAKRARRKKMQADVVSVLLLMLSVVATFLLIRYLFF